MNEFCPQCGTQRVGAFKFCRACGFDFDTGTGGSQPAAAAPSVQSGMAAGLYELEQLRVKLIVGRLLGIAVGLAIWWFVLGPILGGNPIYQLAAFFGLAFLGLWVGQMISLSVVKR